MEGGRGVLGVCVGRVVEVEEVDGGLGGSGPGPWRLVPSALAPSGRGTEARGFLPGCGRLGRRGGGGPWLHSGGSSPVYLVPLWALFSSVWSRMGWALVSSRVWPSRLSGALLPWSSYFWRCHTTRICGPPLSPGSRRRYWIVPSHQIQSPVRSLRKGCWTSAPFSNPGYASGAGGAGGGGEDDEDAWSGWGGGNDGREDDEDALSGFAGWVGGGAGGREVATFPAWLGADAPLFPLARLGGTGGSGAGGAWGLKKGCVACWPGSLSGGSAGICMVAFAWLRVRSASLRTVSGGRLAIAVRPGCRQKGVGGGSSSWPWPA